MSHLLATILAVKCATACYDYADRSVCVYREAETCEPHEVVCTAKMRCVPVERHVANVDVTISPEDDYGDDVVVKVRVR